MYYNFAFFRGCDFSYSWTVFHANSPNGNIFLPYSFASVLDACPLANLAAIPCEIILVLHKQKASAKEKSGVGSHPASVLYHSRIVCRGGYPPVVLGGTKYASKESWSGCTRLAKSDKGCPIVDNSQSRRPMTRGSVGWNTYLLARDNGLFGTMLSSL